MAGDTVTGAFGETEAAALSGVTVGQLKRWDRLGFMHPSYADENRRVPYGRIYSFRDIVTLRVLGQLRNSYGVSLQHLRKVSEKLSHMGDKKWTACTLYVLGKRVVFNDPRSDERVEIVSGQRVFDVPLRVAISDTRQALQEMNRRTPDQFGQVVHGRFTLQNEQVFKGTRIPITAVQSFLDAGHSVDAILSEFPDLSEKDIMEIAARNTGQSAA
ncbi:MAG TPA: DUF433 domain-containing protein [Paracoccaceae bacterium]|nr:DUF433 domain-containing protein [Paracoccaceae bacterium]